MTFFGWCFRILLGSGANSLHLTYQLRICYFQSNIDLLGAPPGSKEKGEVTWGFCLYCLPNSLCLPPPCKRSSEFNCWVYSFPICLKDRPINLELPWRPGSVVCLLWTDQCAWQFASKIASVSRKSWIKRWCRSFRSTSSTSSQDSQFLKQS